MSEKLNDVIKQGRELLAQGENADPGEVQAVLKAAIEADPQGFADAMRDRS